MMTFIFLALVYLVFSDVCRMIQKKESLSQRRKGEASNQHTNLGNKEKEFK
jgi:hypothetical protein|tara:strand:+ start:1542 stop:1694 length:153 start_codon:yes stop_codon:yes gene_type:complete